MGYKEKGLGQFSEWEKSIVERNVNHVADFRNHPSILFWSLGNETGHGICFEAAAEAVRRADSTRPLHWEGGNVIADVDSRMYPSVEWLYDRGRLGDGTLDKDSMTDGHKRDYCRQSKGKPFFMCEYAHSMGNALGNFHEYWDAFYSSDALLGGCIWDWVDQGLVKNTGHYDASGKPVTILGYGADWDEVPNSGPFCCNGVIRPDRKPTAKLIEVGQVYRQIVVTSPDASSLKAKLWNRFSFTSSDAFDGRWSLLEDGVEVAHGNWTVPAVAPLQTAEIDLPDPGYAIKAGKEYFYNVYFCLGKDELWAKKGHVIASDQMVWKNKVVGSINAAKLEVLVKEDEKTVSVATGALEAVFCKKCGILISLRSGGRPIVDEKIGGTFASPRLSCMRALTDNDKWMQNVFNYGLTQMNYHSSAPVVARNDDGSVSVRVKTKACGAKSAGFDHEVCWIFRTDGTVDMVNEVVPFGHMPHFIPRLGLSMMLDDSLENVRWYGLGPSENYIDRCTGSFIGLWESTVTDMYEQYVRPQDNGYRGDVRWIELLTADGHGVRFSADMPLFVQALHYDWEDLHFARHIKGQSRICAMPAARREICLNLDIRQMGLGGNSCGPQTMDKYRFPIQKEKWTIRIEAR